MSELEKVELSPKFLSHLQQKLVGRVYDTVGTRALYASDASNYRHLPLAVAIPACVEDLVSIVRECSKEGVPVTARGAGTSLAGQACNETLVVDCSKYLDRVLDVDPDLMAATVEPGVALQLLDDYASQFGLRFGPDPSTKDVATLGGMYSNNSCGVRSVRYGPTALNVRAVQGITAEGFEFSLGPAATSSGHNPSSCNPGPEDLIASNPYLAQSATLAAELATEISAKFPAIPRRISGYNLDAFLPEALDPVRGVCGSEGTLAVITQLQVRLVPDHKHKFLVVLPFSSIEQAAAAVPDLLKFDPSGLEAIDHELVERCKIAGRHIEVIARLPEGAAWLLLEIDGQSEDEAHERLSSLLRQIESRPGSQSKCTPDFVVLEGLDADAVWSIRKSALAMATLNPKGIRESVGWEDAAVPPQKLAIYLEAFRQLQSEYGLSGAIFGHFGDGCVHTHLSFEFETASGRDRFHRFIHDAARLVVEHNGSLSGEHGDGQARAALLETMFGARIVDGFRRLKTIWDPDGLLNPGRIVQAPSPTSNLRSALPKVISARRKGMAFASNRATFATEFDRCVGAGLCVRKQAWGGNGTMCPTYMATLEERHSTRGRARLLFEMAIGATLKKGWGDQEVAEALEACIGCKACKAECPAAVDIATYRSEFFYQKYGALGLGRKSLADLVLGTSPLWLQATSMPLVRRGIDLAGNSPALRRMLGIARDAELPRVSSRRPSIPEAVIATNVPTAQVILWPDCFTQFFHPGVFESAWRALCALGIEPVAIRRRRMSRFPLCCARPLIEAGMLGIAKRLLKRTAKALFSRQYGGLPVVFLEPSCLSVFRSELKELLDIEEAERLSERALSFSEAVFGLSKSISRRASFDRGRTTDTGPGGQQTEGLGPSGSARKSASVFMHCHQRALWGGGIDAKVLDAIGIEAELVPAGCCGMAGKFGLSRKTRGLSMSIFEHQTRPALDLTPLDRPVIADGFSCRTRLSSSQSRPVMHLAEYLYMAVSGQSAIDPH
ncbi:MAG: FAD-binding oxidoreductase [Acidimicrobiia bacterium]